MENHSTEINQGFILLHRKLKDSIIFADPIGFKIWVWCLLKASHKERFVLLNNGKGNMTIKINPEDFIFGRYKTVDELFIKASRGLVLLILFNWFSTLFKLRGRNRGRIIIKSHKMQTQTLLMLTPEELRDMISEAIKNNIPNPVEKGVELMSRKEVAEFFQISLVTLRSWNLRGVIRSFKVGGRRYYNKNEVESLNNPKYKK